jgi:hypothetical protein
VNNAQDILDIYHQLGDDHLGSAYALGAWHMDDIGRCLIRRTGIPRYLAFLCANHSYISFLNLSSSKNRASILLPLKIRPSSAFTAYQSSQSETIVGNKFESVPVMLRVGS